MDAELSDSTVRQCTRRTGQALWRAPHLVFVGDVALEVLFVDEVGGDALNLVHVQVQPLPSQRFLEQACRVTVLQSAQAMLAVSVHSLVPPCFECSGP